MANLRTKDSATPLMADRNNPDPSNLERKPSRRRARREPVPLPAPLDARDIRCQFCPGHSFRRSRLRGKDVAELLLMRYPVRCLRCSQRQYRSFTVAGLSLSSKVKHSRPVPPLETWKSYTGGAAPAFPGAAPAYISESGLAPERTNIDPSPPASTFHPAPGPGAGRPSGEEPVSAEDAHPPHPDPGKNEIW